jgi:uncharacterized protein (DUF4415 family)
LRKNHRVALAPMDIRLESLNDRLELAQTGINESVDKIKMAEEEQKRAEEQKQEAEEEQKRAEEQKQEAEHNIELAEHKKKHAETVKDNYEQEFSQIRQDIDQTQAARARKNQYWLDLINERLRQYQMDRRR